MHAQSNHCRSGHKLLLLPAVGTALSFMDSEIPSLAVFLTGTWVLSLAVFLSSRPFNTCFVKPSARLPRCFIVALGEPSAQSCAGCSVPRCIRGFLRVHLLTLVPHRSSSASTALYFYQLVGPLFRFLLTCLLSCLSRADTCFRLARDFDARLLLLAQVAIFHFVLLSRVSSLCCAFDCSGSMRKQLPESHLRVS